METERFIIKAIDSNKRLYMPLLLIGDESEAMIDRYIDHGCLHAGFLDGKPIAVCVTVCDDSGVEIKNLAVAAEFRRHGYGRRMLLDVERRHPGRTLFLGTGETPSTLRFYQSCGYTYSHRIPDFFTDNYPAPIIEEGITLRDMLYLKKTLKSDGTGDTADAVENKG